MLFDNDRLSLWFAGAVFTWVMIFLLWGLLVFHLWLRVPIATLGAFASLACALQMAITPWLFSARATSRNPNGLVLRRFAAVIVWFTGTALLICYFVQRGLPSSPDSRLFVTDMFGVTVALGAVGLIVVGVISRRGGSLPSWFR